MSELINKEKLLRELCGMCCAGEKYKCRNPWGECDEAMLIKKQPTIEPERKKGHINICNGHECCSECSRCLGIGYTNYCGYCGAELEVT